MKHYKDSKRLCEVNDYRPEKLLTARKNSSIILFLLAVEHNSISAS